MHLNQPVYIGQKDRTLIFFPAGTDRLGGVVNLQTDTGAPEQTAFAAENLVVDEKAQDIVRGLIGIDIKIIFLV